MHRADFFGCLLHMRITSAGVTCTWSPDPKVKLDPYMQGALRTQFASWRNRFVRQFATERGLSVRPMAEEPDVLEPCETRR